MEPALETVANHQKRERDGERDHDYPPLPGPAGDTDTQAREPGYRRRWSAREPENYVRRGR